ncbi:MAG: spermidine synthase [Acidimicrobiia bacterium]
MPESGGSSARRLYLASALMLFLELTLIRWLGESILYLSFFTNFVLLASFLGIGIGFMTHGRQDWFRHLPIALLLLVAFVTQFRIEIDRSASDVIFIGTGRASGLPPWVILPIVFVASATVMGMAAQRVAAYFSRFEPLQAYKLDILGSLTGIVGFAFLAGLRARPIVWAVVISGLLLMIERRSMTSLGKVALVGTVLVMGIQSLVPGWSWSPYYRVEVLSDDQFSYISVNGIPHQATGNLEDLRELDWIAEWPYRVRRQALSLDSVLVVGAGNGVDVAYALDNKAAHVDAVEIDPRIYELGLELNPERPYDDPRVEIHIDDGRAFMQRTENRYDLVLFALPDSLTSVAGQSNLRLESYLFTSEAFSRARDLLTRQGMFALYNTHSEQWVIDRMAQTITSVFATPPCQLGTTERSRVMLAVGPGLDEGCPGGTFNVATVPEPVTDDRPFLYVEGRSIPSFYLVALGAILAISVAAVKSFGGTLAIGRYPDLFLMGTAFLLLEAKSVSQFALWFGTTWNVNTLVFSGVLLSVLLAIGVSRRLQNPSIGALYAVLLVAVTISWAIPGSALLSLPTAPRWLVACLVTFTPIFVANLVFAERFKNVHSPTAAFGANLLGAMIGGVLEYTSLVTGYRALAIVVGGLYVGALIVWKTRTPTLVAASGS